MAKFIFMKTELKGVAGQPGLTLSVAIEDYAKAVFMLQQKDKGLLVSTSALAERLKVAPASVTAMVKKMAAMKLVEHEPYGGVRLTKSGERVALEVIRHHRLLELYLADAFDMPWDRVHSEAEVLEHVISEELEELIAKKLGDPSTDPHGDPIPTRDGRIDEVDTVVLSELEPGDRGTIVSVSDSNPEMLRYLSQREIGPGQRLTLTEKQPFNGPLHIRLGSREHALGGELARAIRVKLE